MIILITITTEIWVCFKRLHCWELPGFCGKYWNSEGKTVKAVSLWSFAMTRLSAYKLVIATDGHTVWKMR